MIEYWQVPLYVILGILNAYNKIKDWLGIKT